MKHKNLMTRLMAGALALILSVGIGMTPAMAEETDRYGRPVLGPGGDSTSTTTDDSDWDPNKDTDDYKGDLGGDWLPDMGPGIDPTPTTPATNTVTVNDAVPGATYNLYKLLQLEHKDEEYTPEGATEKAKKIVTYRYSYGDGLKDVIGKVVELPQFKYVAEAGGDAEITHPGYGFKVDGENVVFITPTTDDKGDYTEDETVKKLMVAFADELRKRIEATTDADGNPLGDDALKKLQPSQTKEAGNTVPEDGNLTVSFEKVPNGYWMITSNAGARSIIFTSPEEADISQVVNVNEKNPAPTVDKKVLDVDDAAGDVPVEDGVASWQETNDAQIGDTVDFKITVELFRGAENIIVHDNMTDGLTFKELKGVTFHPRKSATEYGREVYKALGGGETTTNPLELTEVVDGNRILKADVADFVSTEHGFTLTFKNAFTNPAEKALNRDETNALNNVFLGDLSTLDDDGGKVEILYSATLNKDAVIGPRTLACTETAADHTHSDACYVDGNVNDAYVKYGHITGVNPGEDPTDSTEPPRESNHDDTKTYTYRFSIDKYVDGDAKTKLAGAEFELRQNFVKIGTDAVEGQNNAYIKDGKLTLPAGEYTIPDTGDHAVAPIALVDITPAGSTTGKVYRVATPEEIADAGVTTTTTIVTDESGQITIEGLDSMLYSITEKTAPKGYIKLTKPEMMAIGSMLSGNGGKVFIEDKAATSKRADENAAYSFNLNTDKANAATTTVGIANASGIQLPRTGGIGTTIFYVLGGAMVVFAAGVGVVVIRKRRDGDAE